MRISKLGEVLKTRKAINKWSKNAFAGGLAASQGFCYRSSSKHAQFQPRPASLWPNLLLFNVA